MSYEWNFWASLAVIVLLSLHSYKVTKQRDGYKRRAELLKEKADKLLADYLKELSEHHDWRKRAEEAERKNKALQDLREQMNAHWQRKIQQLAGRLGAMTQKYNKLTSRQVDE